MTHLTWCLIDRKEGLSVTINITTLDVGECTCLNVLSPVTSSTSNSNELEFAGSILHHIGKRVES